MTEPAPNDRLESVHFQWILAALRHNGAISSEDERLLVAECESRDESSDSVSAPGSRLNDAEYWSLRFVHDLSDALHRSGWIGGAPHAAVCADDLVLADHEEALCARLASAFVTR
jgi:hypothetical protein